MKSKFEFGESYYKSRNYSDYLDREPRYRELANDIRPILANAGCRRVIDFGCSVGFLVKHLKRAGFDCHGYDCSSWAVDYGRRFVTESLSCDECFVRQVWDAAIFLDVLEHNSREDVLSIMRSVRARIVIVRMPVSAKEGGDFHLEISRRDPTHVLRMDKAGWRGLFSESGLEEIKRLSLPTIWDSEGVYSAVLASRVVRT